MQEHAASSQPSSSERSSSSAHHMDMEVKEGKLPIYLCHPVPSNYPLHLLHSCLLFWFNLYHHLSSWIFISTLSSFSFFF